MGFRVNMGATLSCRFHDGYLEVDTPSKRRYKTSVDVNTDWQCNVFSSPVVYFVIWDKNKLYIGLKDGMINVCDKNGLLVSLHNWDPPTDMIFSSVGFYKEEIGSVHEALVWWDEPRLIMIRGKRRTFVLNEGLDVMSIDMSVDDSDTRHSRNLVDVLTVETGKLGVSLKGGEPLDEEKHGYWEIDPVAATNDAIQF